MISEADVQKLRAVRAFEPSVLSLYVWVPADVPSLRELPARADELLAVAGAGMDGQRAVRKGQQERRTVRDMLQAHAREWMGHSVAVFACDQVSLAEAFPLPCRLPDRAVLAVRPHVRPLLVALQRCPAYQVAVVDRRHAWIFLVTGQRVDTLAPSAAPGVRSRGFGGWYGLESYRISQRITQLARHHYRDTAAILSQAMRGSGRPLVVGGHQDTIPAFLAVLPAEVRERFIGSFVVDPHTMTPARVRELSAPVVATWVSQREQQLVTGILQQPPGGLTAVGMNSCLAAVNQHAVSVLVVPVGGLIPGFACQVCGTLASAPGGCPHQPPAVHPVPDLLEEMTAATLDDGGEVVAVPDVPADVAAQLRFPLAEVLGAS
jgi:Bacterial archaeo-eukaryotic release factor family 10